VRPETNEFLQLAQASLLDKDSEQDLHGAWPCKSGSWLPLGWLVLPPPSRAMRLCEEVKSNALAILSIQNEASQEHEVSFWMDVLTQGVHWLKSTASEASRSAQIARAQRSCSIPEDSVSVPDVSSEDLSLSRQMRGTTLESMYMVMRLVLYGACILLVYRMRQHLSIPGYQGMGHTEDDPEVDSDARFGPLRHDTVGLKASDLLVEAVVALKALAKNCRPARSGSKSSRKQGKIKEVLMADAAQTLVWVASLGLLANDLAKGAHSGAVTMYQRCKLSHQVFCCHARFAEHLVGRGLFPAAKDILQQAITEIQQMPNSKGMTAILCAMMRNLAALFWHGAGSDADQGCQHREVTMKLESELLEALSGLQTCSKWAKELTEELLSRKESAEMIRTSRTLSL